MTEPNRIVLGGVVEVRTPIDNVPINHPMERRALALKFAIETKVGLIYGKDESADATADVVISVAKKFEAYMTGEQ